MTDHNYYMGKALDLAEKALSENEFPVGCVLVAGDQIIGQGRRQGTWGGTPNETDHAEMMALRSLKGLFETDSRPPITAYSTMEPCLMCFGALILSGITTIVYAYEDVMGGGTRCDLSVLPPLYRDHPLTIVEKIRRSESLKLFHAYFSSPENSYWKGSLLAQYTLSQSI